MNVQLPRSTTNAATPMPPMMPEIMGTTTAAPAKLVVHNNGHVNDETGTATVGTTVFCTPKHHTAAPENLHDQHNRDIDHQMYSNRISMVCQTIGDELCATTGVNLVQELDAEATSGSESTFRENPKP